MTQNGIICGRVLDLGYLPRACLPRQNTRCLDRCIAQTTRGTPSSRLDLAQKVVEIVRVSKPLPVHARVSERNGAHWLPWLLRDDGERQFQAHGQRCDREHVHTYIHGRRAVLYSQGQLWTYSKEPCVQSRRHRPIAGSRRRRGPKSVEAVSQQRPSSRRQPAHRQGKIQVSWRTKPPATGPPCSTAGTIWFSGPSPTRRPVRACKCWAFLGNLQNIRHSGLHQKVIASHPRRDETGRDV